MKTRLILTFCTLALGSGARACSVCIAHMLGGALHGIGAQVLPKGKSVFGVSHLTFNKSNAGEEPGEREFETYHETAIGFAHGLTDRVMLSGNVPYITKTINSPEGRESTTGMGDASLGLTYQLKPGDKDPVLSAFSLTVKLPTGDNSRKNAEGALLEEHLQPGTGSTDLALGYTFTLETAGYGSALVYGGIQARVNGKNSRDFRYGNVLFYNLGYSHPFGQRVSGNLELVGRIAAKDQVGDGTLDENSGGHVLYVGARLSVQLGKSANLGIGFQLPIIQNLHGDQTERGVFTFGISGRF